MKYFTKSAAVIIVLIVFLIVPKTAIGIPVTDMVVEVNTGIIVTNTGITAGTVQAQLLEINWKWAWDLAQEILKKQLLDMMVDQIVRWIQGGGDPKFITDFPAFFRDAIDQAGGKFLQRAIGPQICSPFQPILRAGFIPVPTFTERTSCTLEQIGVNIDVFLKDFRQGNWIAWNEMVLRPQNNVYGAYILAWDQYEIEKSAAAKSAAAEAQAGKGFLSVRKCVQRDPVAYSNCKAFAGDVEGCEEAACVKWETVTPGAIVGDAAAEIVGADIKWLVNAKDLKAYVAAIANAALNRMFAEGLSQLRTVFASPTGSGGSSGAVVGSSAAQAQCAQLLGTAAYNDCVSAMQTGMDIREFQKNYLISQIDEELNYQNQLLGAKQATLIVLNQSVDVLNQLNNCQGTTPLALAQAQSAASTTANQITQIQSDIIALQIKSQEIKAITDIRQITSFWSQVAGVVKPAVTQSLVLSAQQETSQKQQALGLYQQQLSACQSGF